MRRTKKMKCLGTLVFISVIIFCIPPVRAHDYGVCEGDVITWHATKIIDNQFLSYTINYEVIATIYNFPQPLEYCNGSLNDNGTIYDPYSHSNKGIQPEWLFDIFDRPSVDINFIAIQVELNSLKIGIQNLGDNPEYSFTENNATSWKLEGTGIQGETTWTYFGEVNYTADMVLYSVVEIVVWTSAEDTATESYTWIRTSYAHGPGCVEEVPDEFPTADFTTNNTSGVAPLSIQFTDASVSLDGISSWQWNFGDGSINSTLQNPIHTYTTLGTHTVTLTIVDNDGDDDTITTQITVSDDVVIPGFPLWVLFTVQIVIFAVLINKTRKKINN